jgi:hypothetical protein
VPHYAGPRGEVPRMGCAAGAGRCRQLGPARELFHYCIALLMVEAGKARLVETPPGETGAICMFPYRGPKG